MRKLMLAAGFIGAAFAMGGDAFACGDKLVVVGRGLRPKRARSATQASILVYADPKGALPAALQEGHLREDLERAGHHVRSVTTRAELRSALETGGFDVVLADLASAQGLEEDAKRSTSRPAVLPTLYNPSDAELAAAAREHACVMRAPGSQKDYLAVVNDALALRSKQQQLDKTKAQ